MAVLQLTHLAGFSAALPPHTGCRCRHGPLVQ